MNDINNMGYKGETINFDGKERHLKYPFIALEVIAEKYGSVEEAMEQLRGVEKVDVKAINMIIDLLYAGLIHEDEEITAKYIKNNLSVNAVEIINKITAAFTGSFGQGEVSESNEGEPQSTSTK